jgi:hypothetical protein
MKRQILLLRFSYWAAAIADFCIAILVLIPERMGLTAIEYPMGLVSVIAFSWGGMLLIADRQPFERRWNYRVQRCIISIRSRSDSAHDL